MKNETHHICEGCRVFRRPDAIRGRWYSYIYIDGNEVQKSTGTTDLNKAIKIAEERYAEAQGRARRGQAINTPTFCKAAEERLEERLATVKLAEKRRELTKARASSKRNELTRTIRNYLVPFVEGQLGGRATIDQIGRIDWEVYPDWRQDKRDEELFARQDELGARERELRKTWEQSSRTRAWHDSVEDYIVAKMPTSSHGLGHIQPDVRPSTFATEYAILRDITKWCRRKKLITKYDEPELPKIDRVIRPRLGFSVEEMDTLRKTARKRYMETRRRLRARIGVIGLNRALAADKEAVSRYKTMLALDILCATGMRPGALCALRRTNVLENPPGVETPRPADGPLGKRKRADGTPYPYYAFYVTTKKGGQTLTLPVVPESWALHSIDLLMQMTQGDDYLIGGYSHDLGKAIKKVIREAGLEQGVNGEHRSQYSIRHGYITKQLIVGIPPVVVAANVLSSLEMIERHYSHMNSLHHFDALSGNAR